MWFRVFILIACSTNIIYSNQISRKNSSISLLDGKIKNNFGITKIGPCTVELDDQTVIDLSKIIFFFNSKRIFYFKY
jgi:hypothetical protein